MSEAIYRALADYALAEAAHRPDDSVILADGASLDAPTYVPCDDKPLAVVLDVDETVVLNTGLMRQRAPGNASEGPADYSVRPVPGAVEAIGSLRAAGITVIYNTNRPASMSDSTIATLASIGLDKPVHGKTLFLSGEDGMGANKDGRRGKIAARWCVVAMAGDQLGDFSQLFEQIGSVAARREATLNDPIARNWGHGWFVLPNTAYGTALKGNLADIFPEAAPAANDN
jgi:predicted secreted acid phosphatase